MTQKELIVKHLKEHGKITDLDAYRLYAIRRLGARIWDLKREGFNIISQNTKEKNRFGQTTHFATYVMEE